MSLNVNIHPGNHDPVELGDAASVALAVAGTVLFEAGVAIVTAGREIPRLPGQLGRAAKAFVAAARFSEEYLD